MSMKLPPKNQAGLIPVSKRGGLALMLATGLLALLPIAIILAAPGDLDSGLDNDGKVTTDVDAGGIDEAKDVLIQPDGKILAVGPSSRSTDSFNDFALTRYNSDGSPDTSFSSDGVVLDDFGLGAKMMIANGVGLQADGKIIVAGWGEPNLLSDFVIARYNTNGSRDTSFGGINGPQGTVFWDFNSDTDRANAVAVQADDKIVVAGFATGNSTQYDFALARFNANGSPDTSFGSGGTVTQDIWNGYNEFKDVALQPDGKIVAVGYGGSNVPWPFVARYNANGTPDASFGTWSPGSGFQIIDQFQSLGNGWTGASANGVALQDDGKIVVVGDFTYPNSTIATFVARFNSNGTLDTSFNGNGILTSSPVVGAGLVDVAIQNDGKIILGGTSLGPDSFTNGIEFAVSRLNPDGSADFSFGQNGGAFADFFGSTDTLSAITLQSDGKIVTAGMADQGGGNSSFGLARFEGDPPPVTIVKQANPTAVQPGDTLTYTLNFQAGAGAGSAVIIDALPSQLQNYTYTLSAGLVVTETGGSDYTWQANVPAGGGTITLVGTVDNTISQDTTFNNTAQIQAQSIQNQDSAAVIVDVTPPDTLILGPADPSNETTPSIPLSGNDGAGSGIASFECNLDGGGWNPCSSPYTTPSLSEGQHTLEARAIDNVSLVDTTPASRTWEVDLTPPSAPELLSPADGSLIVGSDTVTLTWTAVVTPEVAAGYYVTFGSPGGPGINVDTNQYVSGQMSADVYTWTVAAQDAAGNLSDYPPARTFTLVPSDATTTLDPAQPASLTQSSPSGGQITVDIPAGAVSEETLLSYKGATTPGQPTGNLKFAGQAFSLDAIQNNQLLDGLTFQTPVTLTLEYTDADVTGLDEETLELFFYDEATNQWSTDGVTVIERDTANNKIVVTITHLTDFALFEQETAGFTVYLPLVTKQ